MGLKMGTVRLENYINNCFEIETVKVIYDKLKDIKN